MRIWLIAALVLGVVAAAAWLVTGALLITVVAALVGAVVAVAVLLSMQRAAGRPRAPAAAAPAAEASWLEHLVQLARLNVRIRESALPEEVTTRLEQSIDVLRRVLPELNDGYVGSELTWTVNKMADDYLPRIVHPYVALSPPARAEAQAELLRSLQGLEAELENVEELIRSAKEGEFKTKAAFLRARFLDDPA